MAKAAIWTVTDAEARKHGEQTGLDTLVVYTVNYECCNFKIFFIKYSRIFLDF